MPHSLVFPHDYKSVIPECVIRIGENCYNCTTWRNLHPGGAEICDLFNGKDATDAFFSLHSKEAIQRLHKMKKLPLRESDTSREEISLNFEKLAADLRAKGFFDREWNIDIFHNIAPVLFMLIFGSMLSYTWPIFSSLLIGLGMQQAGWVGHDFAHGRGKGCHMLAPVFSGLTNGLSTQWWSHKHNRHHVFPNRKNVDVDVHNEPVIFLWPPRKEQDRWFRRYQHLFYPFAYALLYFSWRAQSLQFIMRSRNWNEITFIAISYIWLAFLPWNVAIGSVLVGGFFVAFVVTSNHQPEEMLETNSKYNFITNQFMTTRGVACSDIFFEYFFGGMQYQLEHHLFPTMPRYRYPTLRPLVKKFADENKLEVFNDSVWDIIKLNYRTIKTVALAPAISEDQENKSDCNMVDAAVLQKLEDGYAKLAASDSKSLLKKYLTKEVFDNLKNKKTPTFGSTLLDCIQSGLENHDSGVGIYAPDAESYSVFSDLFDPIIEDYHTGFKKTDKHPARDFGDVSVFGNVDPNNEFVVSTRVRCGRSLEGYPFNPCLTEAQYKEMETKVATTLSGLEGELKGKFYPLTGMEKAVQQQLIDDHFLFKEGDRFLQSANACRYWPSGRGIYHNDNKTFLVWCNEEDHLRIISMQMGGDLGEIYRRLVNAVNDIEKRIPFSHHDRLGFLTFCPSNLGTTIRASVHIKLPKLAANKAKLEEVAAKYNLQVRGTRGEHTEAEGGVYDISNKRRMGLTEFQAVKEMYDGITELIKLEKSM